MEDFLQSTHGFADFRWQDWLYMIISMGICFYLFFYSHKMYPKIIARFERKYKVRISARPRYYQVQGPHPWWYLLWIELQLIFAFLLVYFLPLLMIGVVGWVLGVFE